MSRLDWCVIGFAFFLVATFVGAFILYLGTAYREGGWRKVRESFIIAVIALLALYVVRTAENAHLEMFKEAANRITG